MENGQAIGAAVAVRQRSVARRRERASQLI